MSNSSTTAPTTTTASSLEVTPDQIWSFELRMHVNTFLSIAASSLATYLIVYKATKTMGAYKWFLLNIVFTSVLFDIYLSLVFMPFPLNPAIGSCTFGLFKHFGLLWGGVIPFVLLMQCLGLIGGAVINAAVYRLAAVYGLQRQLTSIYGVVILAVAQIALGLPTTIPAAFVAAQISANQPTIVLDVLRQYPKLEGVLKSDLCFFASFSDEYPLMPWVVACAVIELVFCVVVGCTIWALSLIHLNKRKRMMSRRSFSLHRQLIISLAMQFAVPGVTLVLPFLLMTMLVIFRPNNVQGFMSVGLQLASSHSLLNTITMIVCTTPYRRCVLSFLGELLQTACPFAECIPRKLSGMQKTTNALYVSAFSQAIPVSRSI